MKSSTKAAAHYALFIENQKAKTRMLLTPDERNRLMDLKGYEKKKYVRELRQKYKKEKAS